MILLKIHSQIITRLFLTLVFFSGSEAAADHFKGFHSGSTISLLVSPKPLQNEYSAFDSVMTFTRNENQVKLPCRTSGDFLTGSGGSLDSSKNYSCQIFAKDSVGRVDSIDIVISKKTRQTPSDLQAFEIQQMRLSYRKNSEESPLRDNLKVIFGSHLKKSASMTVPVEESLNRSSYFSLLDKVEKILTEKTLNRRAQPVLSDNQRTIRGFSYHIGYNGVLSVNGRVDGSENLIRMKRNNIAFRHLNQKSLQSSFDIPMIQEKLEAFLLENQNASLMGQKVSKTGFF